MRLAFQDLSVLFKDTKTWAQMQKTAMAQPVGWETSAVAYAELYRSLLEPT